MTPRVARRFTAVTAWIVRQTGFIGIALVLYLLLASREERLDATP